MCQLIVANAGSSHLNKLLVSLAGYHSAIVGNQDGFGIYSDGKELWKTALSAAAISNLSVPLSEHIGAKITMAHTRWASPNIKVTVENAHPFESRRFVLAHNGRLYGEGEVVQTYSVGAGDTSTGSDSLAFLKALQANADADPNKLFPALLKDTMAKFRGKFAFIVFDKKTGLKYAVRGRTADLCVTYLYRANEGADYGKLTADNSTLLGYVIMTKLEDLKKTVFTAIQAEAAAGVDIWVTEPKLMSAEKIYLLERYDVKEVDTIFEVPPLSPVVAFPARAVKTAAPTTTGEVLIQYKYINIITKWAKDNFLNLEMMDNIFYSIYGAGIADMCSDDFEHFAKSYIPVMTPPKKLKKKMLDIYPSLAVFPQYAARGIHPGFQFPWMMNDREVILKVIKAVKAKIT